MPPLSTDYVFMSYSRRDDAVMQRIVTFLRGQGIKVWVDNEKLIPGTPVWEKEIEKAVQGASAVVVVLSPDSKDSEWVRREISLADQYEKRVFPVMVRGDEKTSISIRLIGRQYVDIRSAEDAGLYYVSATLLRYLEELSLREQNAKKEASRLAAQKTKTEKRLAKQKTDEERLIIEKAEAERKAREDADLLAAQRLKLESKEKLTRENSEREAREKLAREKMERDARENAKLEAGIESIIGKPAVIQPETKKQSGMKLQLWGIGLIAIVVLALIVWKLSSLPASPNAIPTSAGSATGIPTIELISALSIGSTMTDNDGTILVYVPSGTFWMGSKIYDEEAPVHLVDLPAYYIDKYEVTNIAYEHCVDAGACNVPKFSNSSTRATYYGRAEFDGYPVIYVDWNMAKNYCEWRDARLPTEAEWEKAARGSDGSTYPWGENLDCRNANYQSSCAGDTKQVGSYLGGVSPYGTYDMAGNVWEWVNDWYDGSYYQNSPSSNPLGPDSGQYRVLRGGSWDGSDYSTRSTYRNRYTPDVVYSGVGFRCARSP